MTISIDSVDSTAISRHLKYIASCAQRGPCLPRPDMHSALTLLRTLNIVPAAWNYQDSKNIKIAKQANYVV
jgi:hypothetical protein